MALDKTGIAKRIAQEVKDGMYVNLGIGIPTLVANYLPKGIEVELQSGYGAFSFRRRRRCRSHQCG
jgi:acyl CoA:acetate/3-ketoacid CoA transferase beta subunit